MKDAETEIAIQLAEYLADIKKDQEATKAAKAYETLKIVLAQPKETK